MSKQLTGKNVLQSLLVVTAAMFLSLFFARPASADIQIHCVGQSPQQARPNYGDLWYADFTWHGEWNSFFKSQKLVEKQFQDSIANSSGTGVVRGDCSEGHPEDPVAIAHYNAAGTKTTTLAFEPTLPKPVNSAQIQCSTLIAPPGGQPKVYYSVIEHRTDPGFWDNYAGSMRDQWIAFNLKSGRDFRGMWTDCDATTSAKMDAAKQSWQASQYASQEVAFKPSFSKLIKDAPTPPLAARTPGFQYRVIGENLKAKNGPQPDCTPEQRYTDSEGHHLCDFTKGVPPVRAVRSRTAQ